MAEEELEGSCGWTNKPCDQLLLLQPTPDCRYHLEDSAQENALDRDGPLHLASCLDVELSSQVKDLSLDSAVQEFYEGAPERECCEPADSSLLSHGLCSPLADTITLELPNTSYSKTEESPTIITNSVSLRTQKEDGNHQKRGLLSCPICQNEYYSPSELKEHFKSHAYTNTDFTCWEGGCFFTTQDRKNFLAHLHQEHQVTPVPCSQRTCKLLFSSREEMSLHFRNHFPFHCNSCDFVSSNVKLFTQHNKKHPPGEETHSGVESMLDPGKEASVRAVTHDMRQTNEEASCVFLPTARPGKRTNSGALNRKGEDEDGECTPRKKKPGKLKTSHNAKAKACKGDVDKGNEHLFKTHMCPECKRCFKKRTHLAEHLHLHFPDPNLQCPNCHKFFTSRSKLKIHMMRESGEKTHRCPLCDYCSVESNALNRHMASIHEEVSNFYSDTYSCPVCQETFKLSQALKDHMKGHKSEQNMLLCFQEGCDHALSDRKEFLRHLKESHGIRGVECTYHACSLLFKSREEMEEHRKKHYAFHCQECDFACSNKHAFRKHKKNGHPGKEELSCLFCPYKSFNPVEYADHVGKMHANEKIHRCGDCSFATAHKRVLIRHMLLHTGEKPHKCNLCDFTCRDISYLSKHMLTHSSEKNYMCTECGYITKWKHYLNVHMRKHSGDLRYQCNQCSYRCHRADQLSSHKLRHQGKNLICEVCGFGCKRKYELQKHMQIKHSQSSQLPVYQCQHCSYQTKYKQALLNHENCKHTKHREFRCALCPYRTFSNTSLFFHKRKSHGYIPGDKDWLEKYASKQQEVNQAGLLFPYNTEASGMPDTNKTVHVVHQTQKCETAALEDQEQVNQQLSDGLQVGEVSEPGEEATITVGDEALMATVTLEPVETCGMVMNDFPVQLELSAPAELLSKGSAEETLVTCENSLPTREEMLCFSETLAVGGNQEFEEETDPRSAGQDQNEKVMCPTTVQYNQETVLCDLNGKCEELPVHVATLDLQPGDIPVEVQESWADVVKDGVELTIVCESEGLVHSDVPETENSANSPVEAQECSGPESVLEVLRKQDKEQAETLVLEGRVQMLVVQSSSQVYKCEKCSYITKKEGSMLQHSKIGCHVRKTSLVCKECGASFKQQRGLNTHVLKKCPVALKKKKAVQAAPSSEEPDRCPESSITQTPGSRRGDDRVQVVTAQGSQWSHMSEHCLEEMDTLTPSQTLVNNHFKETTPKKLILDQEETAAVTSPDPQIEHGDISSFPSGFQENGKYRYDNGRFRCLLCSFSCSRECTISCHVKENCRGLRKSAHVRCPKEPLSEGALGKREQENRREQDLCQEKDPGSESSADDGSQSMEEDEEREENVGDAVVDPDMETQHGARLSCPTCPFTCSQERAMKTHKKKGCLKQGELQCPMCSFRCMSTAALKRHRDLHQKYTRNRAQLQCKQCDFVCKQPRCMKQHVRIRHEGVKPHSCRYCDFSTTRRYRLDAHESLHTGVGRISCDACNRTFGTNSKLRLHQRRVHEKKPTHFCGLCDYSGYSQNDIARHVGSCHSGKPAFPCPVCQASFSSEAALKQHSLRRHQEKATHACPRCPFTCHSPATLRCHLQKQHLQLECGVCKQSFSRRLDLEEHRRSHFSHRCQECRYAAKDRQQLVRHYSEEHEKSAPPATEGQEGPLRCPFCPFSCHHQLVYDHHVKGHGGTKLYKCVDCEYTTRNKQKITWHSRIHTGEKPYKCHLCSYACADPSRLKYHMRIHKDEKKYLCPECGYKCKWINQLKYHMTKHTGVKPYQCEECDYRTNRADALRIHRETRHRDVRSFICEQCGKAFKTRFLLKTHLKKHSEEKPYVCNICQSGFRWPAGLRHHYLTHTNQQPFFCQYCSYRAKQKFQVVKHLQRHHPDYPDVSKGVGKEIYLSAIHPQGLDNLRPTTACEGEALSAEVTQT